MAIIQWKPLWDTRFPSLRDEMDKMFEDFFEKVSFPSTHSDSWAPPLDVSETAKDVIVAVDIPGVDPKEIDISIMEDILSIKGQRKKGEDMTDEECFRSERRFGLFQRTVQLPSDVTADNAKATYVDGVLRIVVPKTQKSAPKEIKVNIQ